MLQPIPEAKRPAVARALVATFGTDTPDSVAALSGGLSGAGVYRIRVGGVAYLLRIELTADMFRDPARWFGCMRAAAEACLAPRVRYASVEDGVAIMDFIEERSLVWDYAGTKTDMAIELAQAVRALHETPPFPAWMDYLDAVDLLISRFRATGFAPEAVVGQPLARYAEAARVYRRLPRDEVSSHNDLNPRNVLYDGRRLWFVDWEVASRADRFIDLSSVLNFFVSDPADEEAVLQTYFRREPEADVRARLFLARQINHVFYGVIFLSGAAAERPGAAMPGVGLEGPSLAELHHGLGLGEPILDSWEGRVAYGKARLATAVRMLDGPGLAPALAALAA